METILAGKSLQEALHKIIQEKASSATISYLVTTLEDDEPQRIIAQKDMNVVHTGASMVKVLIMEYVFYLARKGQLDLSDSVSLSRTPRVEGSGALQELSSKHGFTYLELCRLMMVLSDNWATNLLLQTVGMEDINARAEQLGIEDFEINRFMMDVQAAELGHENKITALGMTKLYAHLYNLRDESLYGSEMWSILGRQQFRDILPFHWGEDVVFHHKTGSLHEVEHDGGVLPTLRGDFCIVVLLSHLRNDDAIQLGALMGKMIKQFIDEALP